MCDYTNWINFKLLLFIRLLSNKMTIIVLHEVAELFVYLLDKFYQHDFKHLDKYTIKIRIKIQIISQLPIFVEVALKTI